MDILALTKDSLRIKGKQIAVVTSPSPLLKTKTQADVVLVLKRHAAPNLTKIEALKIVIEDQGEYELSGTKISSANANDDVVHTLHIDGMSILLGDAQALDRLKEKLGKHHIVIVFVADALHGETLTILEPNVVLLFGNGAEEAAKVIGKGASKFAKYTTSLDKLPEEMEVAVLG